MKMSKKHDLILGVFDTVLQDCHVEPREDERQQLKEALRGRLVFGDLLTETVCLARVPIGWYSDPVVAREELSGEFFSELLSWAADQEETIRGSQNVGEGQIVHAMQSYVEKINRQKDLDVIASMLNEVWCGRARGMQAADQVGWYGGVPREIVAYLGAARAVMPAIGVPALLDDLVARHGKELTTRENTSWEPGAPFRRAAVAALEALEEKGIVPWAGPRRQGSLW